MDAAFALIDSTVSADRVKKQNENSQKMLTGGASTDDVSARASSTIIWKLNYTGCTR